MDDLTSSLPSNTDSNAYKAQTPLRLKSSRIPGPNNRWTGIMEIDDPEQFELLNIPPYDRNDPANIEAFEKSSFTDCFTAEEFHDMMEENDRDIRAGRYAYDSSDYATDEEADRALLKFIEDIGNEAARKVAEERARK